MNQVGCRSIPLETVGEERVRATQRFWLVFRLPLLSLQGSRASAALVVVRAAGAQLCAALLGWLAGRRWLQRLRACGRFDGVQGFAKPRVFCSLDFIHKGSSLMFKFLIKERRLSTLHKRFLCQQKRNRERIQACCFVFNRRAKLPQLSFHNPQKRFIWFLNARKMLRAQISCH